MKISRAFALQRNKKEEKRAEITFPDEFRDTWETSRDCSHRDFHTQGVKNKGIIAFFDPQQSIKSAPQFIKDTDLTS